MGRHNAPSQLRPKLIRLGSLGFAFTASSFALLPSGTAEAADTSQETSILEAIAKCESGNQNVNTRGGSTASGYLQILDSTWRSFGGTAFASRAINASRSEQFIVGARVLAGQGISAWNPSRACWGSKISTTKPRAVITPQPQEFKVIPKKKITPKTKVEKVTPHTSAPKAVRKLQQATPKVVVAKKAAQSYLIRKGDTLSGIARSHHSSVRALFQANRDTIKNPDLIYAGKHLRLG